MNRAQQVGLITALAIAGFFGLRALPDTHCAFLHNDHQPVISNGLEFCGVNEEANYYSPAAMQFPVKLELLLREEGSGYLRLLGEEDRPMLAHEIAISHTRQIHLHLRQNSGRLGYVHLHPSPAEDGSWSFVLPPEFLAGNPGGNFQAFVDFVPVRNRRVMLAEANVQQAFASTKGLSAPPRCRIVSFEPSTTKSGQSATIRVKLSGLEGAPLKLQPLMGSLGHAVLFGDPASSPGYAHMHPSLEGGEYEANPTLSFRLRLPKPGDYDFWLNINDGADQYLHWRLRVTP